jgi:unsaturated chondroitin disaccharide hydrolase
MLAQATNTATHDLGFMLDTNAGRGASMDPEGAARTAYAVTTLTAARSLATRWNPRVGLFQAGTYDGEWGVIIDSAMNADLLFHGAQITSKPDEAARLRAIAHQHLLTLSEDFVRSDGSTRQLIAYDPETGALVGVRDGAAYSTSSTWTRGQSWAIYGFTLGYRRTGDVRLLAAARATADFWLTRIGADCIARWDFDAPADSAFKDSSAGAIAASGLLDLAAIESDTVLAARYRDAALSMTAAITTAAYTTAGMDHPAVLRRQSYAIRTVPFEGSYSWGDYYLLEAMTKSLRVLNVVPKLQLDGRPDWRTPLLVPEPR